MSRKHLENALQAGHRIAASGQQLQQHHHGNLNLTVGPSLAGSPEDEGVYALLYVDEGRQLVLGTGAEGIRCLRTGLDEGGLVTAPTEAVTVKQNQSVGGLAIACIRGIRGHAGLLFAASTSGYVYKADWSTPGFATVVTERGNHLAALDTTEDQLATVGSDCSVRIYDVRTCQPVRIYSSYRDLDPDCPEGHATRLFAARFNADGLLLTAGWDGCVKFWDTRLASSDPVKRLQGPHICSPDGLDVKGDRILTGSYRPGSALQLWDARQCEVPLADWPVDHVYCAKFTAEGTVTAAGAVSRCLSVWHANSAHATLIGQLELDSAAYCLATTDELYPLIANKKDQVNLSAALLAIGCHSGSLQIASLRTQFIMK